MTRFAARRRHSKMDSTERRTMGPWRALRIVLRIILFSALSWLVLALLWAFLPSPASIQNDEHVASILRGGNSLTRVYPSEKWNAGHYDRRGFALSYSLQDLNSPAPSLSVSGSSQKIALFNPALKPYDEPEITIEFHAQARIGDIDGANLPWFTFADAVLLFWWIGRWENMDVELAARWSLVATPESELDVREGQRQSLDISMVNTFAGEPLLSLEIDVHGAEGGGGVEIVSLETGKGSDSPTWTYPIRVAIICVLAPTAVLFNNWFGSLISSGFNALGDAFLVAYVIALCGFVIGAIVVSLWRCFGGPSLESTVGSIQGKLDHLRENGRYSWARVDLLQDGIERVYENGRVQAVLRVCREGWHPERERERLLREREEANDVEKGSRGVKIRIRR